MRLQTLSTLGELESVRSEWEQLWRECPNATPFQSPSWLLPWCRHVHRAPIRTLLIRDAERLVGMLPAYLWQDDDAEPRRLILIGNGISDYTDALAAPGYESDVLAAIAERLGNHPDWDLCRFEDVPDDSILLRLTSPDLELNFDQHSVCPRLSLPRDPVELPNVVPHEAWQMLQYYRRRALKAGAGGIVLATKASLPKLLEEFIRLHTERWQERGRSGVLDESSIRAFHRDAASELLRSGMLRLSALLQNQTVIGVSYGLLWRGRFYYYLGGFRPDMANLSPGRLLIGNALESGIREGVREFDFLRGAEKYKYNWGARDRFTRCIEIMRTDKHSRGTVPAAINSQIGYPP